MHKYLCSIEVSMLFHITRDASRTPDLFHKLFSVFKCYMDLHRHDSQMCLKYRVLSLTYPQSLYFLSVSCRLGVLAYNKLVTCVPRLSPYDSCDGLELEVGDISNALYCEFSTYDG